MKINQLIRVVVIGLLCPWSLRADVKLPAFFSDHMVLQKTARVPVWGKADPGENITVTLSGQSARATADAEGKWKAFLNLKDSAPGPWEMTVAGKNKLTLADVLVGEVWLASGQSNMGFQLHEAMGGAEEIAGSGNPQLRLFRVKITSDFTPLDDVQGAWTSASPDSSGNYSAVAYYFGKKLQKELQVPVGILQVTWGNTPSESWTSPESLDSLPDYKDARLRHTEEVKGLPGRIKAFAEAMKTWLSANKREDKPVVDASIYAGEKVSATGWTTVKLPGVVSATGLPKSGAVWLRKEVNLLPADRLKPLEITLPVDGFDSLYWNGKFRTQTTSDNYPGRGKSRRFGPYNIDIADLKPGRNVIAIRLYEPVSSAVFFGNPTAGAIALAGDWQARAEYALPDLDAVQLASAPKLPEAGVQANHVPGTIYNGMIHPIQGYAIRGAIWYQGENNAGRAWQYRTGFPLLINDWRRHWAQGDFPFYFCQLANFKEKKALPAESEWAELREAQCRTLTLPNTAQAVIIDVGESADIHPRDKKTVGERLAPIALAREYGARIPSSGPLYQSRRIADGKIILSFQHAEGGLVARPVPDTYVVRSLVNETAPLQRNSPKSQLEGFAICGADRHWIWADAKITGDNVVVWSEQVPKPVAVRYAWADNPTCNLWNGAGFPASPFRTDDFPLTTLNKKY